MDSPLLAFTRRQGGAPAGLTAETAATENMRQLIQLRWVAVAGQTATILFVRYGLGIPLPLAEMLGVAGLLGVLNFAARLALPRHRVREDEVMLALLVDWGALTLQLYFSGGAANPFVALYLLQVVLGAILLPPMLAVALFAATILGYGLLAARALPLRLPDMAAASRANLFAIGHGIAFVLVAVLLLLFIVRISRNLRARDAYLADLRQHAAEEEGIVRMGLFASGAAHELGTPLGTLSVILADWRRMPAITGNADLVAEVQEMQAEVQRCKGIVSDILRSAGQERGEAMASMAAAEFLESVAGVWRATQPGVPVALDVAGLDGAAIAVDPALRQALTSLLDNAAEASPIGLRLLARREDDMLAITVRDYGQGFDPAALAHVGKLYHSTKGAGHGLGLFLATNVARRMGGRLEARNPPNGGAEVRLVLPLLPQETR